MSFFRNRPTATLEGGVGTPSRAGRYAEAYTLPIGTGGRNGAADEGSYYVAQNATAGTTLTGHVAPAISDTNTKSIIHGYNAGTKSVSLDFIKLSTVVANASATAVIFAAYTDQKGSTGLTSGGTAITTIYPTRSDITTASGLNITAGACVTAPTTNIHRVMQQVVKPYIGVALDGYSFSFGNGIFAPTGFALVTAVTQTLTSAAPVVVEPGGNFYFVQTGPSGATTAMTFEFEMGWVER